MPILASTAFATSGASPVSLPSGVAKPKGASLAKPMRMKPCALARSRVVSARAEEAKEKVDAASVRPAVLCSKWRRVMIVLDMRFSLKHRDWVPVFGRVSLLYTSDLDMLQGKM